MVYSAFVKFCQRSTERGYNKWHGRPIALTINTLKWIAFSHVVMSDLFAMPAAVGPSMLPTFSVMGDWFFVDMRQRWNRLGQIRVGDIVVYRIPVEHEGDGIKRVIGMPGDYVLAGTPGSSRDDDLIQVPQGHIWLGGDNMTVSRDSRIYGPVPLGLVKGKCLAKILPLSERQWIKNPLEKVE